MKKALVLLLALALVGAAFAAPDADLAPSVSGDATLSWGLTIGAMSNPAKASGFSNVATAAIKMPLIKKATVTKGEGDVYGWIELKDFQLGIQGVFAALDSTLPTVTAKIVFGPAYVKVYSWGGIGEGYIANIKDGEVAVAAAYDGGGAVVGYSANGLTMELELGSKSDWLTNTTNEYAIGANAAYVVGPATIKADFAYDLTDETKASPIGFGLSAPITIALAKGLTITPSMDAAYVTATGAVDPLTWDAGLTAELLLSDNNADGNPAKANATVYYSGVDEDMEVSISFTEVEGGGILENLDATASLTIVDLISPALIDNAGYWEAKVAAGYTVIINDANKVHAGFDFGTTDTIYDNALDAVNALTLHVIFTNTQIANTTITATYQSGDVLVEGTVAEPDLGSFVLAAKVAY